MNRLCKGLCVSLALLLTLGFTLPAAALETFTGEPEIPATEPTSQTAPALTEAATEPVQTVPATEPPQQTIPETTAETVPGVTEPAQTEPAPATEPEEEPQTGVEWDVTSVPVYYQTDYPDTIYANGTIASNGCSITCLAMVATYMTGYEYRPDMLADYFGAYIGNNMERLEYVSDMLQLPWSKAGNWHEALKALEEGCVVIVLMNQKSAFTTGQHFMVLTGLTEDGKVLVNDPNENNYSLWNLKDGFENGFPQGYISTGYSGAWIYDKSAMPDEPFIYQPEETVHVEPRYDFTLTDEETELLARMIWVEAQGESIEGQQAVAEVVLNRLAADNFQSTLRSVIYADDQFRSTAHLDEAEPTQTQYEAVERALYGPYILPIDVVFFATYPVNENVWGEIGGHVFCYQWD